MEMETEMQITTSLQAQVCSRWLILEARQSDQNLGEHHKALQKTKTNRSTNIEQLT